MIINSTQPEALSKKAEESLILFKPGVPTSGLNDFPHKVYHVRLDDVKGEKGFSNPQQVSWRYILSDPTLTADDSKKTFGLEIRSLELNNERVKYEFQEIQYGNVIESTKTLLASLKDYPELNGEEEYEASYLRMIFIMMNAIWFRAAERKNDYFIPLPPYFFGLEPNKLYTSAEFLEIAKEAVPSFFFQDEPTDS